MAEKRHPGITMHKFTVGAGFEGCLFTVGCSLIFVFGLPALWVFVAFSTAFGIAVALILHLAGGYRSDRKKPLSIFTANEAAEESTARAADKRQNWQPRLPGLALSVSTRTASGLG
jgi:hypothetical protein